MTSRSESQVPPASFRRTPPNQKRGRILAVDDEPLVLQLITLQAEKLGYQVSTAPGGPAALEIMANKRFDLLLTDILMPEMDGLTFMAEARRRQPELEVIVISGQHEIKTAVAAMKQGAVNYLQKPFSPQEIEVALEKGMEHCRLRRLLREKQEELARSNRELDNHRRHLEQLVEARTAELAATNRQLQADIRARQRAEMEAEQRRRQLIEADKLASLGILVAGVAHEINNPNNFITINTPLLQRIWTDTSAILDRQLANHGDFTVAGLPFSELREYVPELLTGIIDGSDRITRIVRNLNDYARQSAAEMGQVFDLNQVVRAALALLASPLKKATHNLQIDLACDLPPIKGNFQRVEQVVINLLQNACQALDSPENGITVRTAHDTNHNQVILKVIDQGGGIPARDLEKIQDPFFTTKRDCGGTGLGLSVSAGIMEEHGGRLHFTSLPGQGTTARAIFPATAADNG
ncbi:hybrid sensor histidine kinase/response regulator [Desulfurivibrio dismutans]|uniref:hybrid sensor histidine kinase/response regulator n=1 Tax=Desulfurivibrio dismutans TaxID=1398908 RepID=UPI0023DAB873|nr:response regulator [Desulfurivibrio alkaliphilus]MDF1614614.1 response regulator [Desulfurivibrio alkaliphilus]